MLVIGLYTLAIFCGVGAFVLSFKKRDYITTAALREVKRNDY